MWRYGGAVRSSASALLAVKRPPLLQLMLFWLRLMAKEG